MNKSISLAALARLTILHNASPVLNDPNPSRPPTIRRAKPDIIRFTKPDLDGPVNGVGLLPQPIADLDERLPGLIIRDSPFGGVLRELSGDRHGKSVTVQIHRARPLEASLKLTRQSNVNTLYPSSCATLPSLCNHQTHLPTQLVSHGRNWAVNKNSWVI